MEIPEPDQPRIGKSAVPPLTPQRLIRYVLVFLAGAGLATALTILAQHRERTPASGDLRALLARKSAPAALPESPTTRAANRILPAVVNIDAYTRNWTGGRSGQRRVLSTPQGSGSGVVIAPEGYIITNNHLIEGAESIRVTTSQNARMTARVVGSDPTNDLALLRVPATGLVHAELGDSDTLRIGDEVLAIGNPLGVGITVTHGIVSAAERRDLHVGNGHFLHRVIQTDAAINHGNSGGALANLAGQLIGISTAIMSDTGGNIGIGFAIPSNTVRGVVKDLMTPGRRPAPPPEPYLGIVFREISPEGAAQIGLRDGVGLIVEQVLPGSGAGTAGIHEGDVVVRIDGLVIHHGDDVRKAIQDRHPGDTIPIRLYRPDGSEREVRLKAGARQAPAPTP